MRQHLNLNNPLSTVLVVHSGALVLVRVLLRVLLLV
jgi:hypothetical protein